MKLSFTEFFSDVKNSIMNFQYKAGISRKYYVSVLAIFCQLRSILHPSLCASHGGDSHDCASLWPSAPFCFCWRHQQIREWKEREAGVDGVLMTWPTLRSRLFRQWHWGSSFHTALSCLQPPVTLPLPCPISPGSHSFLLLTAPGCLTIPFGSVNSAHVSVKSTFIKRPRGKPLGRHWFLAKTMTHK